MEDVEAFFLDEIAARARVRAVSHVTNYILTCGGAEEPAIEALNALLEHLSGQKFVRVDDRAGGSKHMEATVLLLAANHMTPDAVIEALDKTTSQFDYLDGVRLFVLDEHEDFFRERAAWLPRPRMFVCRRCSSVRELPPDPEHPFGWTDKPQPPYLCGQCVGQRCMAHPGEVEPCPHHDRPTEAYTDDELDKIDERPLDAVVTIEKPN